MFSMSSFVTPHLVASFLSLNSYTFGLLFAKRFMYAFNCFRSRPSLA